LNKLRQLRQELQQTGNLGADEVERHAKRLGEHTKGLTAKVNAAIRDLGKFSVRPNHAEAWLLPGKAAVIADIAARLLMTPCGLSSGSRVASVATSTP
jgi:hypothetical protein